VETFKDLADAFSEELLFLELRVQALQTLGFRSQFLQLVKDLLEQFIVLGP
jgi:hypothetical protein